MSEDIAAYAARIRTAYNQLVAMHGIRPGDWVSLTDLRSQTGGYRKQVDAALRDMSRNRMAYLTPESNQKTLTDADREAAIEIGNQDKHLIAIEH